VLVVCASLFIVSLLFTYYLILSAFVANKDIYLQRRGEDEQSDVRGPLLVQILCLFFIRDTTKIIPVCDCLKGGFNTHRPRGRSIARCCGLDY